MKHTWVNERGTLPSDHPFSGVYPPSYSQAQTYKQIRNTIHSTIW